MNLRQDQLTCNRRDQKQIWKAPRIMDRLICGDVGFGKTEVALRAAFKAVQDGKQVAFLVPTTILAKQIFTNTFDAENEGFRLSEVRYAVQVPYCRAKQKKTLEGLKERAGGRCRRYTQTPIQAMSATRICGLLIIDEEQRFGVRTQGEDQAGARIQLMSLTLDRQRRFRGHSI